MKSQSIVLAKAKQLLAFFHLPKINTNFMWYLFRGYNIVMGSITISFSNMFIGQTSKLDYLPPFKPILGETYAIS